MCVIDVSNKRKTGKWRKIGLFPAGFEPATLCVWSTRDNHYTMETSLPFVANKLLPPFEIKSFCSGICSRHIRGAEQKFTSAHGWPPWPRAIIALRARTRDFGHILAVPLFLKWKLHPLNQVRRQRSIKRLCSKHTKVPKSVISKTFGSVSDIWWLILDFISNRGSI